MGNLILKKITSANYKNLVTENAVDSSAIYFISDKGVIYARGQKFSGNVEIMESSENPENPELNTIYIYPDLSARVYNGISFDTISKGYTVTINDESNDNCVPTAKDVATYVSNRIQGLTESGLGVSNIDVGNTDGLSITVTKDGETLNKPLTGAAYNPAFDGSVLTIPVVGGDTLSIKIANVFTAGKYDNENQEIVLTMDENGDYDDETKLVKFSVSELIDIYTGGETSTAKVEVTADNKINVNVNISEKDGNLLVKESDGLYVSADNSKLDKVETSHTNEIVIANADGSIKASGTMIGGDELSAESNLLATEKAVKAYADSVAANAKNEAVSEAESLAITAESNAKDYADKLVEWENW